MDSRDRLRRYLEQRRELGESEYVLDSLSVEAVMRLVDAKPGATKRGAKPALQSEGIGRGSAVSSDESLSAPPSEGPAMPMTPPALPPTRFDEATSTDWRAALGGLGPSTQRSNRNPAESPEAGGNRPPLPFESLYHMNGYGKPFPRSQAVVEELEADHLIQSPAPTPWRETELDYLKNALGIKGNGLI